MDLETKYDPVKHRRDEADDAPQDAATARQSKEAEREAFPRVTPGSDLVEPGTDASEDRDSRKDSEASALRRLANFAGRILSSVRYVVFASLTRRIVFLNLAALAVLLSGILYLNQFREGLIDARVESLRSQGTIIAAAIATNASVETNNLTVDPEKLIELQAGETALPSVPSFETLDSPIRTERVAPVLRALIQPTRTRARIYDKDGFLLLDSRHLYAGGQILRYDLPPLEEDQEGMITRIGQTLNRWLQRRDLPIYEEISGSGPAYPEVVTALSGQPSTVVRMTQKGELIVSVAVPVQRFRAVMGALLLSTQAGDIDRIVAEERIAIMRVFLAAGIVLVVLSFLLAGTIANPLRKLSEAAVRVRYSLKSRVQIPDFSKRGDEIANLSQSLREMTNALYARIEAIESFAADVSHELKNPLTSLRSAVETLPLAKTSSSRDRLMEIIQHDVRRLDRLITDISDASRLDAELAREDSTPVNLKEMVGRIVEMQAIVGRSRKPAEITFHVGRKAHDDESWIVPGHETRIGQVINNLIDNARSFVPESGGKIQVTLRRGGDHVEIVIDDNGPGIRAENIERIFERFYTDRPEEEGFGQNSGLGLSISRQIIEAHGGTLTAFNLPAPRTGARFIVRLPEE